ncbi:hypothetical protein VTL71DRAFT_2157 [Oculimacula yallundae]|uniref:Uncharacterized protein n=1 Tax=Oculimacula yallundae TaxID=86028 RepID=A0ABR4C824_9HELO
MGIGQTIIMAWYDRPALTSHNSHCNCIRKEPRIFSSSIIIIIVILRSLSHAHLINQLASELSNFSPPFEFCHASSFLLLLACLFLPAVRTVSLRKDT